MAHDKEEDFSSSESDITDEGSDGGVDDDEIDDEQVAANLYNQDDLVLEEDVFVEDDGFGEEDDDDVGDLTDEHTINVSENHKFEIVSKDKTYERIETRKRITNSMMTTYELTKIIGVRAQQISSGMEPLVEVDPDIRDTKFIAIQELLQKKMPLIIRRFLPNGVYEDWRVDDLIIPKTVLF